MSPDDARVLPAALLLLVLLPVGLGPLARPRASALAAQPALALVDHAYELTKTNQWAECVTVAAQATSLDPLSARAFNNLAFCEARLGRWDAAVGHALTATQLDPSLQLARNNLAWMREERSRMAASPGSED